MEWQKMDWYVFGFYIYRSLSEVETVCMSLSTTVCFNYFIEKSHMHVLLANAKIFCLTGTVCNGWVKVKGRLRWQ